MRETGGWWKAWVFAAVCAGASGWAHGQALKRPPLLQERLNPEPRYGDTQVQLLWPRALLDLGIEAAAPGGSDRPGYSSSSCFYPTALETLRRLRREFGATSSYPKIWARNQDRVFSACDGRGAGTTPPEPTAGRGLPLRASSDFAYQLASWHFYKDEYDAALPLFEKVAAERRAPQRANASYMVLRSLAYLKRLDDAYAAIDRVLADPSLREVHRIAANYRFVIMSNSNHFALLEAGLVSPPLAKRHLQWLHDTLLVDAERAIDPTQAAADAKDAREQMAIYFPYHDKEGRLDWWLHDGETESARMQAVKELARKLPLVDWMQANWAPNIFATDWLWALHDKDNPAWKGNASIVAHAWQRWQRDGNGSWLQVAILRVHPRDPLAGDILAAARAYLAHPWTRPRQEESVEYTAWVFSLWDNAVRLHLGLGQTDEAITLAARSRDTLRVLDIFERRPLLGPVDTDPAGTVDRALRWLVYLGEVQQARALLAAVRPQFPEALRKWRSLLAISVSEAHAAGEAQLPYRFGGSVGNDPAGWERMLDDLSSEALYRLASSSTLQQRYRPLLARTALARALMLRYDEQLVDRYAALAGRLDPSAREALLAGVAPHSRSAYISLLLRSPRLRPAVMAEYARPPDHGVPSSGKELASDAIDVYNHNDNNWWCAFRQDRIRDRVFKAWRIAPEPGRLFGGERIEAEVALHLDKQRALLDAHPYRTLVDRKEIEALEALPSGPRYLAEAVIEREKTSPGNRSAEDRSARAADLHRAVRATRYGCKRDGSLADPSRGAFQLLQDRYGDTPWAKATPYWFR